ncbi:hypothetical protein ACVWXO_002857 [Bradyrhizobium sp. LM2.7]
MPRKKTTSEATARYAALKAKWEARHSDPNYAGGGDWLIDKPALSLDAAPFLQTLRALGNLTQDRRFTELHQAIMRSDLIDLATGKWSRYGTTVANPLTRDMCELIEELIARGISERLAIAEAVAELAIGAQSFEAACKSVKRVLDETRNTVRQKPA